MSARNPMHFKWEVTNDRKPVTIHTLPHLKCIRLVSMRSSHLPYKNMNELHSNFRRGFILAGVEKVLSLRRSERKAFSLRSLIVSVVRNRSPGSFGFTSLTWNPISDSVKVRATFLSRVERVESLHCSDLKVAVNWQHSTNTALQRWFTGLRRIKYRF